MVTGCPDVVNHVWAIDVRSTASSTAENRLTDAASYAAILELFDGFPEHDIKISGVFPKF